MKELAGENSPQKAKPRTEKQHKTNKTIDWKSIIITVAVVAMIAIAVSSWVFIKCGISNGADELASSYQSAYQAEREEAHKKFYETAFNWAEEQYHTSNIVNISIGRLEEVQQLEVLRAGDQEFVIESKDENTDNVTAWLEVEGEGTFVVNLKAAEYIVDNVRKHVTVRAPLPELINVNIKYTRRALFNDDDLSDGDYKGGVNLYLKQRKKALLLVQKSMSSNQFIFDAAKDNAKSAIEQIIREVNPTVPDLKVTVEFF